MADCVYHPGTHAEVICKRCYRPLCRACVVEIPYEQYYCRVCASIPEKASSLAKASLVVAIAGAAIFGVLAVAGMIMGIVEIGRINRDESPEAGRGYAKAGIVIGALAFVSGLAAIIWYLLPLLFLPV